MGDGIQRKRRVQRRTQALALDALREMQQQQQRFVSGRNGNNGPVPLGTGGQPKGNLPGSVGAPNGGSVVRYNISQDDYAVLRGVVDAPFSCAAEENISVYNNTVYTRDPRVTTILEDTNDSAASFVDNLIVGPGPPGVHL